VERFRKPSATPKEPTVVALDTVHVSFEEKPTLQEQSNQASVTPQSRALPELIVSVLQENHQGT
jgi:hypothetical protein